MSSVRATKRVRTLYRLVTDVCQSGHDAKAWTHCLMEGLAEVFEARMVSLAWATIPERPGECNHSEIQLHHGFTDEETRHWSQAYCGPDRKFQGEFLRRVVNIPARFVTVRRQDVMNDEDWYALPEIQAVHRRLDIDANMASFFVSLSMGRIFGIAIHRAWNGSQFTIDERRMFRLVHLELARAWRNRLAAPNDGDAAIRALPERPRQVLWLLCLGRSEKEIAEHLTISPHTVHNHVKRLHELLSVSCRGELLARAYQSRGTGDPLSLPKQAMNEFGIPWRHVISRDGHARSCEHL
jgi:DNA-binding CsgD family transcriptional regulator